MKTKQKKQKKSTSGIQVANQVVLMFKIKVAAVIVEFKSSRLCIEGNNKYKI